MSSKVTLFVIVGLLMLAVAGAVALPPEQGARAYDALRAEAERFYAEKSFSRAHQIYEDAAKLQLTPEQRQWVEFRLADTTLRADVASPSRDPRERDAARAALETLANVPTLALINAEANEALGDFYAFHRMHRDPSQSQRFYLRALDFWAGAENIDVARRRYLSIVWRMAGGAEGYHNIRNVPRDVLVNADRIAVTHEDRARARYFLAQRYLAEGNGASAERAFELFEEVIRDGRGTEYYDDALFAYGTALLQWSDMAVQADRDEALPAPDYAKALALFRRLRAEFTDTTSEFHDDAAAAIEQITKVSVDVTATATFVPDSEQELALTWRNAPKIELTLYSIDLTTDLVRSAREHDWKQWIAYQNKPVVRRWTHETQTAAYEPGQETLRLNPRLAPGAYMLTARTGTELAEEVVLVTDAHIVVHSAGSRAKVFVSDVETGEPIANARVRVLTHKEKDDARTFTTDATGIADVPVANEGIAVITAAAGAARQAWHQAYIHSYNPGRNEEHWRIYAFTDRPAYRPNETVQWKIIARTRDDDRWTTPTGSVEYTITDPRGEKVANGVAKLNAYGSFWSELALTPEMALGEYTITFMNGQQHRGQAQLFRLEEYKLPEFTVSVSTPDGKQYRLGETIEATIDASYYFGGPVAGATVEAVVYQTPLVRYWWPWREYPWYYHDIHAPHAPEQVVTRETLVTDANGRAILRIDTQRDARDSSYRIEARVVDASRREVRGTGSVNVMRQRYTVLAQPEHFIHRPGESVSIRFKAMDANERPVRTTGTVEVLRRRWRERAYVDEEVMTTKLDTDAQGEATLTFTPKEIGYYLVRWTSPDGDGNRVRDRVITETTIWVTDRNTTDIGYYHAGGVDLIVDKETLRAGETASVMVVVPASGRWVLLSTSADTLLDTRVVKMNGTVQLVQFPI
ncbi:MAG TPA: MG2 domain-containing protein, partial [Thermoanaerobaculia bacterium]|nr:MG2 domain-containing protein [Thermoanaerobaculia bacterium]